MANKIKIKSVDCKALVKLVKSLQLIDKFIFLTITKDTITSSVFLKNKDAVKLVKVDTASIFKIDDFSFDKIRMSFHDSSKLVNSLLYFDDAKADLNLIEYEDFYYVNDITFSNSKLKIKIHCGDPSHQFIEMTPEQTKIAFGIDDCLFKFNLSLEDLNEINSLMSLDKTDSIFDFVFNDNKVYFKTKAYELQVSDKAKIIGSTNKVTVYKKYLGHLDKEDYDVFICENKVVLKSKISNTIITFALCIVDDADSNIEEALNELNDSEDIPF